MASQLGEAFVLLRGDDARLRSDLNRAKADTDRAATSMAASANKVKIAWASVGRAMTLAVTLPLIAGMGYAAKAAAQEEDAEMDLIRALARTGEATTANVKKFSDYASAIQKVTVYDDEMLLSGMAMLKNYGVQTSQMEDATKAAIGLADRYGVDVKTAFMLVGRAAMGQTQMLTRYGIVLDQTGDKAAQFAQLLRVGISAFPMAEAKAKTTSGQFKQLNNAMGDLVEVLGKGVLPLVKIFVDAARPMIAILSALPGPIRSVGLAMLVGMASIGPLITLIGNLGKAYKWLAAQQVAAAIASAVVWAKGNWAVAAGAGIAITTAIAAAVKGINSLLASGEQNLESYMNVLNAAMKEAKGQSLPGLPGSPVDKAQTDAVKAAADEAARIANEQNDIYKEQAREVWDIYENLKAAREEEEKRMRTAIGWTQAADMWKGAAVAGVAARFGAIHEPTKFGRPDIRNEFQIETQLMQKALAIQQRDAENTQAIKYHMETLVDYLRRMNNALVQPGVA